LEYLQDSSSLFVSVRFFQPTLPSEKNLLNQLIRSFHIQLAKKDNEKNTKNRYQHHPCYQ